MRSMDVGIKTDEDINLIIKLNKNKPICIIVAGPNGSGKSTLINSWKGTFEYLNFDQIVKELETNRFSLKAGKTLLKRFNYVVKEQISFVYETVLADKSKFLENAILEMKKKQYFIILIYTWVSSIDECKRRVKDRVRKGGHLVSDEIIEIRYPRSLDNYLNHYLFKCDYSLCFNNDIEPELVFSMEDNKIKVYNNKTWRNMLNR